MIQECLMIMESGDIEDLFEIIPRIGVLRDSRFHDPLLHFLAEKQVKQREFAAYAMGAMGNREFLEPLKQAFLESAEMKGFGVEELQIAVIEAIGAIGDDAAADFFVPIVKTDAAGREKGKIAKWIVESLGAIAQQGGTRSLEALLELTGHADGEIRGLALSELSVAYWHRPNDIEDSTLEKIYELTQDQDPYVAECAVASLQSLADVGCQRAEKLFSPNS
jgi:HEAT repeat protein